MIRNLAAFAGDVVNALPIVRRIAELERRVLQLEQRPTAEPIVLGFDGAYSDDVVIGVPVEVRPPPQ